MSVASAFVAAVVVFAAGCGNLARDVIFDQSQSQIELDGGEDAAGAAWGDASGSRGSEGKSEYWRCERDGGCRRSIEESCNRYRCEDWCQYVCASASEECRAKVHCHQSTPREGQL